MDGRGGPGDCALGVRHRQGAWVFQVSSPAVIAAKERINGIRAKMRKYSCQEYDAAMRIKWLIDEQRKLEVEATNWTVHLQKLQSEEGAGPWSLKNMISGLL